MINELYLAEAGLRVHSNLDRWGDIVIECGKTEGNINKDDAERIIKHFSAVFEINLAEMHND